MKKILLLSSLLVVLFLQTTVSQVTSPILTKPPEGASIIPTTVTFRWQDLTGVLSYTLIIAQDPLFLTQTGPGYSTTDTCLTLPEGTLGSNTVYYWKVRGEYTSGPGPFSAAFNFRTAGTASQEVTNLESSIGSLVSSNGLSQVQANILDNRLNQAQHQIDLGHTFNAAIHLVLFEVRVTILQFSNQLDDAAAGSLRDYATSIIEIMYGFRKMNLAQFDQYITPNEFSLKQNYPNPFNPNTNIEYSVPERTNVSLKIYDILGKEVATLVDKQQDAGTYIVNWNASNFSSGVYFYKITAGSNTAVKRMSLTK